MNIHYNRVKAKYLSIKLSSLFVILSSFLLYSTD